MKTLKREEIYANDYQDLEQLLGNIEAFIEQYYNRSRLHSALGYRPPEEFEREAKTAASKLSQKKGSPLMDVPKLCQNRMV